MTAFVVGLISDTHGLLRPEALAALAGSDHIVHAGDIGDPAILEALRAIAPVTAVRGNVDVAAWARKVPWSETVEVAGARIHVVHDIRSLAVDPRAANIAAVVAGHSHQPRIEEREGVLFVNPGSAGPRRFTLPVSVGRLHVSEGRVRAELETLAVAPPKKPRR